MTREDHKSTDSANGKRLKSIAKPSVCMICLPMSELLKRNAQSIGGAELQRLMLGKELASRGYDVTCLTVSFDRKDLVEDIPFRLIPTFDRSNDGLPGLGFFYPRLYKIWKGLSNSKADIFYYRDRGFILAIVVLFSRIHKRKVVFCAKSDTDFDWENVRLGRRFAKYLYFWGLRRGDGYVVQNEAQLESLRRNIGKKGVLIPNGFYRSPKESSFTGGVLWVSSIRKAKDPLVFVETARRVRSQKFVMVGGVHVETADKQEEEFFLHVKEEAGKVPNLTFKGFQPLETVEMLFSTAKLLVNTSPVEGFPTPFLQAWSRGIPVVSFVNPSSLIDKNELGIVVKNKEQMSEAVEKICTGEISFSPGRIKRFFEETFTIEAVADQYEKVFSSPEIIGAGRSNLSKADT